MHITASMLISAVSRWMPFESEVTQGRAAAPRESRRLELVSLAAEIATLAARSRDDLLRCRENEAAVAECLDECLVIEQAALCVLYPAGDMDAFSRAEREIALDILRDLQEQATMLRQKTSAMLRPIQFPL